MYFYIVTKDGYKLYQHFTSNLSLGDYAHVLMSHSHYMGYTEFRRDASLIGGYWVNSAGDAMIASPVELDKDGNVA